MIYPKKMYEYYVYSLLVLILGIIPYVNIILAMPLSFYFAFKVFIFAKQQQKRSHKIIGYILSVINMLNAVIWEIIAVIMLFANLGLINL